MSSAIQIYFPDRPVVPDLLFIYTPYVSWMQYISDIANVIGPLLLGLYVFRSNAHRLPYVLLAFGIAELARGCMIILTPLGGPLGNGAQYGLTNIIQNGQFPSGHTIVVTLCYLLVDRQTAPIIKVLLLANVGLEVISLILSRWHYAIDIIGGLMVATLTYLWVINFEKKQSGQSYAS